MKVSFSLLLEDDPTFLQQVVFNVSSDWVALKVKVDVHVLSEARRVVIAVGLGIAECLQHGVRLKQHVLYTETYDPCYLLS